MSGLELAERLRRDQPDLPAVFVTGYATEFQAGDRLLPACTTVLTKPFTQNTLARTVRRMVHAH